MDREWDIFAAVPEDALARLLATARRRTFVRGEVVFHQGDPADTLHLVRRGRFAVRASTQFADTAILSVIGPGQLFGELALLQPGEARSATVAALEDAETLSIHQVDFTRLRRDHPATNEVLIAVLSAQVRRLTRHLLEALHLPAETRVRRRLIELSAVYEGPVPLTQDELADLAGTSRATVNKVLREDQRHGRLRLERGRTHVLDLEALRRLSG